MCSRVNDNEIDIFETAITKFISVTKHKLLDYELFIETLRTAFSLLHLCSKSTIYAVYIYFVFLSLL